MLLLDFAVACVDCTGGNKKKKKKPHGNRFNNNIDREYLSVNNKTLTTDIGHEVTQVVECSAKWMHSYISFQTKFICSIYLQYFVLTLTVLVTTIDALGHFNRVITAQCEGMGEVGSARYEPALLPPCPSIRALSYSNCQRSTHSNIRAWQFKC